MILDYIRASIDYIDTDSISDLQNFVNAIGGALDDIEYLDFDYLSDEDFDAKFYVDGLFRSLCPRYPRRSDLETGYRFDDDKFKAKYIEKLSSI